MWCAHLDDAIPLPRGEKLIVINRINADIDGNESNETYEIVGEFHSVLRKYGRAT